METIISARPKGSRKNKLEGDMSTGYVQTSPFGVRAIYNGFVTGDQVLETLSIQEREDANGNEHRFIGEILVSLGYMQKSQVEKVLQNTFDDKPLKRKPLEP